LNGNLAQRVLEILSPCLDEAAVLDRLADVLGEWVPHDAYMVAEVRADAEPPRLQIRQRQGFADPPIRDEVAVPHLLGRRQLPTAAEWIDDLAAAPAPMAALFAPYELRSLLVVPLVVEDEPRAVVLLAARRPQAFAPVSAAAVDTFRRLVEIPLGNARRFATARQQRDATVHLAAQLYALVSAAGTNGAPLPELLRLALEVTGADAGTIMAASRDANALYVDAQQGLRGHYPPAAQLPWGAQALAALQNVTSPQRYADLAALQAPSFRGFAEAEGVRTYVGVPVRHGGGLVGLLNLYGRDTALAPLDREHLGLVIGAVGVVLEQARLRAVAQQCDVLRAEFRRHKGDLLGLMAHQLRTPLTTIKGFAQLMLRRSQTSENATNAKYAATVVREANRLAVMVDNVLDMERLEAAVLDVAQHPFDLRALLLDLLDDPALSTAAGERPIQGHLPPKALLVCGDAGRVRDALLLLAQRAGRRAPAAPLEITLTADLTTAGAKRRVAVSLSGGEPADTMPSLDALLAHLDLRNITDAGSAQYNELLLYNALLLLRAQGADLAVRAEAGTLHYVVSFEPVGVV
jgi:signal transduction histidine kinase